MMLSKVVNLQHQAWLNMKVGSPMYFSAAPEMYFSAAPEARNASQSEHIDQDICSTDREIYAVTIISAVQK